MGEISFGALLLRLFQTARRFNMVIMPQLLLLQKTLVNIEGLGRDLYPELNIWSTARPLLEKWLDDQVGVRGVIRGLRNNLPYWLDRLPGFPTRVLDLVERLSDGRFQFEWKQVELERIRHELHENNRRTILAIIGAALLIGGIVMAGPATVPAARTEIIAWLLGFAGAVSLYFCLRR
jgi:ubiquinone biosynthesis protein